jgi:hypothetical protein
MPKINKRWSQATQGLFLLRILWGMLSSLLKSEASRFHSLFANQPIIIASQDDYYFTHIAKRKKIVEILNYERQLC